ncbi:MAG TPA: SpoIIE family protein phosphatase [Solirubrobacteraceae bacterium]|jgi:PAS domain S-box-containing protein|nr:SpoIIE family protein phosphatase [Solirubrobacteraceae bacterium]
MSAELGVSGTGTDLLVEAGAVLASSLDLATTMRQVARLTVPRLADLCVIDLQAQDGTIGQVAAAAADAQLARSLEELRQRFPISPHGEHPVAAVIRSGEPLLLAEMSQPLLRAIAEGSEHGRFMIDHRYHSAVVVPLPARGRTLGTLSVLRLGDSAPYAEDDLGLISELARRAALAIDNARLFSELHAVQQRLEGLLGNLAEAITMEDEQGETVFANDAAAELLGLSSPQDAIGAPPGSLRARFLTTDERGRELNGDEMPARRLFAGAEPEPLVVRNIVRATGEERWLVVRSSPVVDPDTKRITHAVNVFENITGVKRAEVSEAFIAEASRILASSVDYTTTLRQVARLTVPQIADWCTIDVLGDDDEIERVALRHVNPDRQRALEELDRLYAPRLDEEVGIGEVLRNGQARLYSDIDAEAVARYAHDREHLELLVALGANSVIVAPMQGATKSPIGTITLGSSETPRRLVRADVGLAVRLGRRTGSAVERARIYTERARIAHILQRALLPDELPEIPGAEVRALYSAAGQLNEVGGDFYDVFDCGEKGWMMLVGDVVGKGPRAASVTALARHTLRAAAISGQAPPQMLQTLHGALQRQPQGADLCTVCLVKVTRAGERFDLNIALAGHEPPLLVEASGEAQRVGRLGTLLGVIDPISVSETAAQLASGQTLLLFTDGVTEAGRPASPLGESGLRRLCGEASGLALQELLERIEHAALEHSEGALHDDIALLALRVDGGPGGAER